MDNVEGDLSTRGQLYRISDDHFESDIMPTITSSDTVILVELADNNYDDSKQEETKLKRLRFVQLCVACSSLGASICRVGFDAAVVSVSGGKKEEDNNERMLRTVCHDRYVDLPRPTRCLLGPSLYMGYDGFMLKLALNIITTCGQIQNGMV